ATFAALADPTRRAIIARLAVGETTVTELARPFDMSLPASSKHLKVLERAGAMPSGGPAGWNQGDSKRLTPGSPATVASGSAATLAWTTTWCRFNETS